MVRRYVLAAVTAIVTIVVLVTAAAISLGGHSKTDFVVEPSPVPVATNVPAPPTTSATPPPAPVTTTSPASTLPATQPPAISAPANSATASSVLAASTPAPPAPATTAPALPTTRATITAPPVPTTAPRPAVVTTPPAPPTTSGNAADFSLVGYRWNPCKVITISSTGPDVTAVVGELAAVTGLHFQVVSGLADITVIFGLVSVGAEVGVTAWKALGSWLFQAVVTISPQAPYMATVLRHELGHAMGLSHVNQANEIMYPSVGAGSPSTYQAGDQAGLRAVGASKGC